MPRSVTIRLGDTDVQLCQLRTREASAWRKSLEGPAREVVGQVSKLLNWSNVDLADSAALNDLAGAALPLLTDSLDTVRGLVASYAPELRETLDAAYDDEVVAAFLAVLRFAYPLAQLTEAVRGLTSLGSMTPPTGANSASASGVVGTTS